MKIEYDLSEPVKAYNYFLKDAIHEAASNYFDGLTTKNNIDVNANYFTIQELNKFRKKVEEIKSRLNGKKSLKGFIIFVIVLFFVAALITLFITVSHFIWWEILIILGFIGAAVGFIFLLRRINKKIKGIQDELNKNQKQVDELLAEAKKQMQPLNDDYDWNLPAKILSDTIPMIQMDQYFDQNKFYYLRNKYGFKENEDNISSIFVQSGSILGNPFILERNFVREIRDHVYTGRLTIHWTTSGPNGKTRHHSQVLTATVTKPAPEYFNETWLVYGNDAAPKLFFSRTPNPASSFDEKRLKKYVDSFEKDLEKKVKSSSYNKAPITIMSNSEFEALFNATNRDNDVEFRLLFTPLAQKNVIDLLKSKKPYGDDFSFIKNKELNYIKSKHMQKADIDGDPGRFVNYDYEVARKTFIDYCDQYFESFYFELAPLLSIPLYQQHRSFEEIFKGTVDPNITSLETEVIANRYDEALFKDPASVTPAILKRSVVRKNGQQGDIVNIRAYSYRTVAHTEYVTKMGGDGFPHNVPVVWYEYIPLTKVTPIAVQTCRTTEKKFRYNIQNQALRDFLSRISEKGVIIYQRGLVSFLLRSNTSSYNEDELNNYLLKDN